LSGGFRGTGEGPITPLPGHESEIPTPPENFVPYQLSKPNADLFNLAVNGSSAKLSAKGAKSAAAFELARQNEGFAEGNYVNPLAKKLDMAMGPQKVLDADGNP
jgi:hypothetical protein